MKFIYLCGPTVYDKVHIGNMRPIVTFDIFIRAMKKLGENVTLIHNITDIDDKIIVKSQETMTSEAEISNTYYSFYKDMLSQYNVNTIIDMPRVTENMDLIIKSIKDLIKKKKAYVSGSVYFDIKSIPSYGSLSKNKISHVKNELKDINKRNPEDFVIWKLKDSGLSWDSPWGKGRPGWHTECFSFIENFGQGKVNIHGGGIDLKFPHHENENAQFISLYDDEITNKWIHIGLINFKGQKMSKSENNFLYADDFLNIQSSHHNSDIFRLMILNSHYKNTIEFTDSIYLDTSKKLNSIVKIFNILSVEDNFVFSNLLNIRDILELVKDLNFSAAMKEINKKIKVFNETKNIKEGNELISIFKVLGFHFTDKLISENDKHIYRLWREQTKLKNWKRSDELRNQIAHIFGQK
ncbi:MAG: class I tRNA ligase family protein [Mycoplasmataceae bacterium]|nr:class I tRNA ligase family protein [Mycoplasmataceae bacterium]